MFEVPTAFVQPRKIVSYDRGLFQYFRYTKAYFYISTFVDQANTLVKGKGYGDAPPMGEYLKMLSGILDSVSGIFEATPPVERQDRYGNPSFRTFIDKLGQYVAEMHSGILAGHEDALVEVSCYFLDMFGSYGRLDYGTGHELNFVCWILCFVRLQIIGTFDDIYNVVLRLFPKYIEICLGIQNVYTLEPAGSHGAWSVDDYNLLPFVFGSAYFCREKTSADGERIEREEAPCGVKAIFDRELVTRLESENMYMRMISNINTVKSYDLITNSPFISEIHMKPDMSWQRINQGMLRHWYNEVLDKWPVIQHFWFGNIMAWK